MNKEICHGIYSVGVDDPDLAKFENQYPLTSGVSYNSYVVCGGDKTALLDSVDRRCTGQWLERVAAAAPQGVDYLIVLHMEPDHSASIADFMTRYPGAVIVASAPALKILGQFFPEVDFAGKTLAVGDGDSLQLGSETLTFYGAPMIHWPEVMVAYHPASGTVFSADAFGTFGTDSAADWAPEARRYYSNIVGKYGSQTQKLLAKIAALPSVGRICPLHGPVLSGEVLARAMKLYDLWSRYEPEEPQGVLVAYASIYGNTAEVALNAARQIEARGVKAAAIDLCSRDVSFAVGEAFRFGRIICASPTYDAGLFPAMHDFLYHLQIKGVRNRRFGLIENGSWAPNAARFMSAMIGQLKSCEVVGPTVTLRSTANATTADVLGQLVDNILNSAE
ncbi:MAG: FprA family A-type flavoprotein [Muribaculaceae bacterium]|nr:FprA family A-type flavoprotein [Muribaculaceae bacterium]